MAIVPVPAVERNMLVGIDKIFQYLSDRGVSTPEERDEFGIKIFTAEDIGKRNDNRAAIVFTHYDFQGHPIEWFSSRLIETSISFGSALANRGKTYCPPREPPAAYLPPTLDWTDIPEGSPVFVHESVLKAINGAKLGYYSIGLNGVWGWGSKKHEIALISQIKDLPWLSKKLQCVVVFDSNVATNDDVHAALAKFAERMGYICKVDVLHLPLPKPPAEFGKPDWGFDDFTKFYGPTVANDFLAKWRENAVPAAMSELDTMMLQLNNECAVVRNMSCIVEQESGTIMTRAKFTEVNYAHYTVMVEQGEKLIQTSVPRLWLANPKRTTVERVDYLPGQALIAEGAYNTWRSSDVYPAEGSVDKWLELLEFSIPDPALRKWYIQWLAYPLQNPGKKMDSFVFIYGYPRTGKQAALAPLLHIYGKENAITVGKEDLESSFNGIYAQRQFVVFDEMNKGSKSDPETTYNKLKKLTTLDTLVVNTKGIPQYNIRNCLNFAVIANYPDALKLDQGDGRCCVIEFGARDKTLGKPWFTEYFKWVEDVGASYVYDYLLRYPLDDFNPHGDAPMTEIKQIATTAARRADEEWINTLWYDPDAVLPPIVDGRCLFTNEELATMCYQDDPQGVSLGLKKTFGVKMHAAGFHRQQLKIGKAPVWFYIVRKRNEEWDPARMRTHLKTHGFKGLA